MKLLMLWFCFAVALAASAQSPLSKLPRVELYGRTYVRLQDWADANGFKVTNLDKHHAQAVSKWARLKFEIDSRRAEIDGVAVYLSVIVAARNGELYLSPLDLQTAIHPVLFPVKSVPPPKIRTICLDPGHGGTDSGKNAGGHAEKKYTLKFAEELRDKLVDAGFKVVFTRTTDKAVELAGRPDFARRKGADLFLSLHFNSFATADAQGVEVYCLTPAGASSSNARGEGAESTSYPGNKLNSKNMLLAYQLQKNLTRNLGLDDRGVRRARFVVLKTAAMPAILIEGGFMTNPGELKKIINAEHRPEMASAIVDGILAYKRLAER